MVPISSKREWEEQIIVIEWTSASDDRSAIEVRDGERY